jgi:plasmid maintenance system antidote protein VapI
MENRVLKVIDNSGLTAAEFALKVGIQSAQISHIKSGRNKVSLEIVQRILANFDEINPDWLILGKGEMYRNSTKTFENQENKQENRPFQPEMASLFDNPTYNSTENAKEIELKDNHEEVVANEAKNEMPDENVVDENVSSSSTSLENKTFEKKENFENSDDSTIANMESSNDDDKFKNHTESNQQNNQTENPSLNIITSSDQRTVKKIIVFYSDKTYDEFIKV